MPGGSLSPDSRAQLANAITAFRQRGRGQMGDRGAGAKQYADAAKSFPRGANATLADVHKWVERYGSMEGGEQRNQLSKVRTEITGAGYNPYNMKGQTALSKEVGQRLIRGGAPITAAPLVKSAAPSIGTLVGTVAKVAPRLGLFGLAVGAVAVGAAYLTKRAEQKDVADSAPSPSSAPASGPAPAQYKDTWTDSRGRSYQRRNEAVRTRQ